MNRQLPSGCLLKTVLKLPGGGKNPLVKSLSSITAGKAFGITQDSFKDMEIKFSH